MRNNSIIPEHLSLLLSNKMICAENQVTCFSVTSEIATHKNSNSKSTNKKVRFSASLSIYQVLGRDLFHSCDSKVNLYNYRYIVLPASSEKPQLSSLTAQVHNKEHLYILIYHNYQTCPTKKSMQLTVYKIK